jgi:DNA-directed RNA polymerase I subunit RPA2
MGKQTMGTPSTAIAHRTDNKLYRLQTPQTPIVRPLKPHSDYAMDAFPNGTNAVVAVISYTGYDMEDAMILNKSAHERGFGYGTVFKSMIVDLLDQKGAQKLAKEPNLHFGIGRDIKPKPPPSEGAMKEVDPVFDYIDLDGLPLVGINVSAGDYIAAYTDDVTRRTSFVKYKGDETAYIDQVRLLGASFSRLTLSFHLIFGG